jgi:cell division protein FtsW
VLLLLTPILGTEIKGARRWLSLGGFSLQPSELVKPAFIVVTAWLLSVRRRDPKFPGFMLSTALAGLIAALLLAQPDLGQTVVICAIWFGQIFLAGLPLWTVPALGGMAVGGGFAAYFTLPHVQLRIDRFLDPATGDTFQIDRSIQAFVEGGWFGRGPGEGVVKQHLPDAHADFVFAVAGEELGIVACTIIVILFATVVMRGVASALKENSLFALLATAGLAAEFGLQALINMASSLALIPTKGMTLPFISYGGSSLLAISLSAGFILALTRRRPGPPEEP